MLQEGIPYITPGQSPQPDHRGNDDRGSRPWRPRSPTRIREL